MYSNCKLSGFECPAQGFITNQLGEVGRLQIKTVADCLAAMDWADQLNAEPDASPLKEFQQRVAERKQRSENDFTDLDSAEELLKHTEEEVVEGCANLGPYVEAHPELIGRSVLRCGSEAAHLVTTHSWVVLPESA